MGTGDSLHEGHSTPGLGRGTLATEDEDVSCLGLRNVHF